MSLGEQLNAVQVEVNQSKDELEKKLTLAPTASSEARTLEERRSTLRGLQSMLRQREKTIGRLAADTAKKEVSLSKREGEWATVNEKLVKRRVDIAKEEERLKVKEAELSDRELDCLQWEKELKTASIKTAVGIVAKTVEREAGDFKARLDALFEFRM
jgi:septal ring factor EnvC (AmiA/AmiB activator)